jgi:branched-chain amino acid transport system permease protein
MAEALLQQFVSGVSVGLGYALIALGLTLIFGVLHVINFGHGEIVMIGALSVLLMGSLLGVHYLAALPVAIIVGAAVGYVTNLIAVEPLSARPGARTDVFLATFALGVLLHETVLSTWGRAPALVEGVKGRIVVGPLSLTNQRMFVIIAAIATLAIVEYIVRRTRFGVEIRAVAQSRYAAQVVGINIRRVSAWTFVLASAIAGLGGALLAPITSFSPQIGEAALLKGFAIVVVAGLGSAPGAVIAALLIGIAEAMLGFFVDARILTGLVLGLMLLVLLIRPHGLFARHS